MITKPPTEESTERRREIPELGSRRERRQVTALFYDIVGSTELLSRHDPEDFGAAQRRIHEEAALLIQGHGGHLDRVQGDGGCAYFGYPVPIEDAAESAVAAALELIDRCRSLPIHTSIGVPLHIRVGIATGLAILSADEGSGEIVGLAPNLASRAQAEAEADTIVVTESAYRLTRSAFEYASLGVHPLKGFEKPQHLWRPLRRRPSEDRFSLFRRAATPLTGRDKELALCLHRWERTKEGRGQVIFLTGEAGIGKSRLVTELRREVSACQHCETRVLQCQPRGNGRPLHPFLSHIAQKCGASADPHLALNVEDLRKYLAASVPENAAAVDLLLFVIGQQEKASNPYNQLAGVTSGELQHRIIAAVLDIIGSWSQICPQLIVFEDMQWADTLTRAMVEALVDKVKSLPILLVATTRDWLPDDLGSTPHVLTLCLTRLDARAVRDVVDSVFSPMSPPKGLDAFVQYKSEGVPLFAEELALLLRERLDVSESTPDHWRRVLRKEGIITLQDLLAARLASTGTARRVAQIASVIGRDFSRNLVARLAKWDLAAPPLDECLTQLMKAGLVWQSGGADDVAYRFGHVLVQEAAYESLLKSERHEFHNRLVQLVLDLGELDMSDELLSWHCAQAERFVEAATYAIRAAEAYAVRSATKDADRLLGAAEGYLKSDPVEPQVDGLTLQLLATRGPIATALYGVGSPEARAVYERGISLCRNKALGQAEKWFPLYWGWWFTAPDFGTQRMRSRIIIGDLDKAGDPEVRLQALHCAWATEFNAGNLANCLRCIERGLMLYDPDRARLSRVKYGGHDAKVCGLGERALAFWFIGENARESAQAALQWAEDIGHRGSLCHALDIVALLHFFERSVDDVAAIARRIQELGELHSLPGMNAKAKIFGGWSHALTTSVLEGLRLFGEGLDMLREIGTEEDFPIYFDMHAEILLRAERFEAAIELLGRAIERAHRTGHVLWLPELYRRRAIIGETRGDAKEACLGDLQDALCHAEAQGAKMLARRARAEIERLSAVPSTCQAPTMVRSSTSLMG